MDKVILKLNTSDGRICQISPVDNVNLLRLVCDAGLVSDNEFVKCVLNNCWISGDETIKNDEHALNSLLIQIKDSLVIPECFIERIDSTIILNCNNCKLAIKRPSHSDLAKAERLNPKNLLFETNIQLLKMLSLDILNFENIRMNFSKEFMAMVIKADSLQERKKLTIKRF